MLVTPSGTDQSLQPSVVANVTVVGVLAAPADPATAVTATSSDTPPNAASEQNAVAIIFRADRAFTTRTLSAVLQDPRHLGGAPYVVSTHRAVKVGVMAAPAEFDPGSTSERLLELIGDTHGLLDIDEFRGELLPAVRRAVPADWISLNDIGSDPDTMVGIVEPQIAPPERDVFARYAHENPLIDHYARTHDGRVRRFSDVTTAERLHALNIYIEFYKPLGIEHQLAFTLPHRPERILAVALSRTTHDFTDAECALLERARPFLIQSYRNAIRYSEPRATRAAPVPPRAPDLDRLVALGLTNRQAEVLRLVATGAAEHEIAASLNISYRTVQKHLEQCYRRLGVNSRSQAAGVAWSTADTSHSMRRQPPGLIGPGW